MLKGYSLQQLLLCPIPHREFRGMSYTSAIKSGLRPYEYTSVVAASCREAVLDFKIWGKTPCLGCYFRDIATGEKFALYAHGDSHSSRYTPRDGGVDFSQVGIEGNVYYLVTHITRRGKTGWQSARLLHGLDLQTALPDRAL